jgi:hypothetical protein
MFYANVLLHGTSFDPRSSLIGNMTLTISIQSHSKKKGFVFAFIAYIKLKKEKNKKPGNKTMLSNLSLGLATLALGLQR